MILNKIIKGKDLYTETQKYWMDQNLLIVEALRLLEHNNQDQGIETNSNYELATKNLITHLFHRRLSSAIEDTCVGGSTRTATPRYVSSFAVMMKLWRTSRNSLHLGLIRIYLKTRSLISWSYLYLESDRRNYWFKGFDSETQGMSDCKLPRKSYWRRANDNTNTKK